MNKIIFLLILWHITFFLPIINDTEAQVARLIVDSSSFEMISARNPFTPQVPQEDVSAQQEKPAWPVKTEGPVVTPLLPVVGTPPASMPRPENIARPPILEEPMPNLTISGLVWNTDRPQAIINGQIAGIGDTISGIRILDIQKTGITVLFREKTKVLEIAP